MSHLDEQIELCIDAMRVNYGLTFDNRQFNIVVGRLRGDEIFATSMCARCKMSQLLVDVVLPGDKSRSNWDCAVKIGLRCDKTMERFDLDAVYMVDADRIEGFLPVNYSHRVFCPFVEPE